MTTRRDVFRLGAVGALGLAGLKKGDDATPSPTPSSTRSRTPSPTASPTPSPTASPLKASQLAPKNMPAPYNGVFRRPPELRPFETGFDDGDPSRPYERYALTQQLGQAQIVPGLSTTVAGYNGIFPGPTIRATQGTRTEVRIRNGFPTLGLLHPTTFNTVTHLHGSASLPQYDGYANDFTAPGNVKNYHYPNWQAARTLWYHDHNHHVTAQNVYSGLAAFYPLSDEFERAQLPQGEFDVPLMISDAMFHADGSLAYNHNGHKGFWGDIILVNGVPWPTMKVKPRIYRFRVLNASVARSYRPTLSNGDPMHLVATDGGMVPTVQPLKSWRHSAAERYEVLIDFRHYRTGQMVEMRNLSNKNNIDFRNTGKIMRFEVVEDSGSGAGSISSIPATLDDGGARHPDRGGIATMDLTPDMVVAKRDLKLARKNSQWTINGVTWADVEKSGFTKLFGNPKPYDVEQWTIINGSGGWFHPVHVHLADSKVIGRNTNGGKPFLWETGPKDVYYAGENESLTVLMQFNTGEDAGGRYMVHCHNLVHEDHDMMVQFSVGDLRNNDPITTDPAVLDLTPFGSFPPSYRPGFPAGT